MEDYNELTGLLTPNQREFLTQGDAEMSDRGKRAAKSRIRDRLRRAFGDFHVLLENYDTEELAEAVDPSKNMNLDEAPRLGGEGAANGIGFLLAARATNHIWQLNHGPDDWEALEGLLEEGVIRACRFHGYAVDEIDVDLTVSARQMADLGAEELAALPFKTLVEMQQKGEISDEELAEAMQLQTGDGTTVELEDGKISISYPESGRDAE